MSGDGHSVDKEDRGVENINWASAQRPIWTQHLVTGSGDRGINESEKGD